MTDIVMFDESHHDALVKARTALGQVQTIIEKAKACGIDCADKEQRRNEYDQILALYQQHFMPHLGHG